MIVIVIVCRAISISLFSLFSACPYPPLINLHTAAGTLGIENVSEPCLKRAEAYDEQDAQSPELPVVRLSCRDSAADLPAQTGPFYECCGDPKATFFFDSVSVLECLHLLSPSFSLSLSVCLVGAQWFVIIKHTPVFTFLCFYCRCTRPRRSTQMLQSS